MTTGQQHMISEPTRLARSTDIGARLQGVLRTQLQDHLSRVYPDDGVFGERLTFAAATDTFTIIGDSDCTDGIGNVLVLDEATEPGTAIAFENSNAVQYYVGLEKCERPVGIQNNPRTGAPEYQYTEEDIGSSGAPTSVADLGGTIQFNINSVLESGVDHSGRQVMVYLNTPDANATTEAVAIETLTSTYSAPNNLIETVGTLGQSTVSTTAADYTVIVLGPTVRRNTDLRTVSGVVFLGLVTGGGAGNPPTAFDTDDQNVIDVSLSSFNQALDAFIQEVDVSVEALTKPGTGERALMSTAVQLTDAVYYNGNIFVMGGQDAAAAETNANQAFNIAGNAWAARTAVPSQANGGPAADGRVDARMAVIDNIIYYIGGINGGTYVELVQRYNADTDTWLTPAADLPAARAGGAVGVINGRIYYAGGYSAAGVGEDNVYEYNPLLDEWNEVAAISTAAVLEAWHMAYAVIENRLYIAGGQVNGGSRTAMTFVYDPAVDTWTQLTDMPRYDFSNNSGPAMGVAGAAVNGIFHVFGGDWLSGHSNAPAHMMYNHLLDEWYIADEPAWPGATYHVCAVDEDGVIYLMGGLRYEADATLAQAVVGYNSAFDASQLYLADAPGIASITGVRSESTALSAAQTDNPYSNEPFPDMPSGARTGARACVLNGRIFVSGGHDATPTWSQALEMYCPETNAWTALADIPTFGRSHHGFMSDEETNTLWLTHGLSAAGTERQEILKYEVGQNDWITHNAASGLFRARGSYARIGKTLVWAGGIDSGAVVLDTVHYYDINLDFYTAGPTLNTVRRDSAMVVIPHKSLGGESDIDNRADLMQAGYQLVLLGGHDGVSALDSIEYLDSRDASWVEVASFMASARCNHAAVLFEFDPDQRLIMVVGGNDGAANENSYVSFYADALWEGQAGNVNMAEATGRDGCAAAALDGFVYVFGGSDFAGATAYDTVEVYGGYRPKRMLLENYSAQSTTYTNANAVKRNKRETVSFRRGHIWGVGNWHPIANVDMVRIGE